MTIEITGPNGAIFDFPDDTPSENITGFIQKHYGTAPPPTNPIAAAAGAGPGDPRFTPGAMQVKQLVRGVPVIGPAVGERLSAGLSALANPLTGAGSPGATIAERYRKDLPQEQAARAAWEAAHPVQSTVLQGAGGTAALGLVGGEVPMAARALGMVGRAREAVPLAAASGALLGGADAAARGEDPRVGMLQGAASGAGGVLLGKGVGRVWDAARGMFVDRPRVPNTITAAGVQVPVRESVITKDPATAAVEQGMIGTQQPDAMAAEAQTQAAMQQAHDSLYNQLDPTGQGQRATGLEAGGAVSNDLVAREQARAQADVARQAAAATGTQQLVEDLGRLPPAPAPAAPPAASVRDMFNDPNVARRAGMPGGGGAAPPASAPPIPGPSAPLDVAQTVGERVRELFRAARARTNAAYTRFRGQAASYNPARLVGVGNDIRTRLDAPGPDRVSLDPNLTPQGLNALHMIDQEVGQLQFTNAARAPGQPPPRPITPDDMNNVLKKLVGYRRLANATARQTGNYEDARAVGRVADEFQNWLERTTTRPDGLLSGNPADVLSSLQAARQAHAQERATFSRRGAGDVVGQFMERVIGKQPGQEMSPEKIVSTLLGSPDSPFAANAVPILTHLRDNVLGANSASWAAIKRAAVTNLTQRPAGAVEDVPLAKQAARVEKLLSHRQLADTLFSPEEQARLRSHSGTLRAAEPAAAPAASTIEGMIGRLSGRGGGLPASPQQVISALKGSQGGALALELQKPGVLQPGTWGKVKQGFLRDAIQEKDGAIPWGDQKIGNRIANFLATDVAQKMYSPTERALIKEIGDMHTGMIPPPGTRNVSASGYELKRAGKAMFKQVMALMGLAHGGLGGAIRSAAFAKGAEELGAWRAAQQAKDLFYGRRLPLARQGAYYPARFGALAGAALPPALRDLQSSSQ